MPMDLECSRLTESFYDSNQNYFLIYYLQLTIKSRKNVTRKSGDEVDTIFVNTACHNGPIYRNPHCEYCNCYKSYMWQHSIRHFDNIILWTGEKSMNWTGIIPSWMKWCWLIKWAGICIAFTLCIVCSKYDISDWSGQTNWF